MFNMVTLDGFFEGLNHIIEWHNVDNEFNEFAISTRFSRNSLIWSNYV